MGLSLAVGVDEQARRYYRLKELTANQLEIIDCAPMECGSNAGFLCHCLLKNG